MSEDIKNKVEAHFSRSAALYRTSAVHAKGEDLPLLPQAAALQGDEHVLDAGCGAGHAALAVAPHCARVVACDLSAAMLAQVRKLAQERSLENITTQEADVEQLPFADETFDVVLSRLSGHHWPRPKAALDEFARVLKAGGRAVLVDNVAPDDDPATDTFWQMMEYLRDTSHVRAHSVAQWRAMFEAAGFRVEVRHRWEKRLAFQSWVERIGTPHFHQAMIKTLLDEASQAVHEWLQIDEQYNFTLHAALFVGVKAS